MGAAPYSYKSNHKLGHISKLVAGIRGPHKRLQLYFKHIYLILCLLKSVLLQKDYQYKDSLMVVVSSTQMSHSAVQFFW